MFILSTDFLHVMKGLNVSNFKVKKTFEGDLSRPTIYGR